MVRRFAALLAVIALLGFGVPVARAATSTSVTLDPVPASVLPGTALTLKAHVVPVDALGIVEFDYSTNGGSTWIPVAVSPSVSGTFTGR